MGMNVAVFEVGKTEEFLAAFKGEESQGHRVGDVHYPDCFIVTTHSPDSNWQPTSEPITCGFCIKRG